MLCGGPAAAGEIRQFHETIVAAESGSNAPGKQPNLSVIGALLVAELTLNTDSVYRVVKIPKHYVSDAAFHVHWTKAEGAAGDGDESGKVVRWRISYHVFPGSGSDVNVAPAVLEYEDTYDAADTTERTVYRTPNLPAAGFIANYYLAVCIEAITPVGTAMAAEPALVTVDLTYDERINR